MITNTDFNVDLRSLHYLLIHHFNMPDTDYELRQGQEYLALEREIEAQKESDYDDYMDSLNEEQENFYEDPLNYQYEEE